MTLVPGVNMNSRERVLTSLRHEEPDRLPLDSGGCSATSISAVAYSNLKQHLGIEEGPVAVSDVIQQLTMPEQWYLDMFDVDVIDITRDYALDTGGWKPWTLANDAEGLIPPWIELEKDNGGWVSLGDNGERLGRMPEKGWYFDQTHWPMIDVEPEFWDKATDYVGNTIWAKMPRPLAHLSSSPEYPRLMREAARKLYEETDYALMLNSGTSLFETAQFLRRTDTILMDLATDAAAMEKLLDSILWMNLGTLERQLDAVGEYVQVVKINDDWGLQTGLFISPEMWRKVFKSHYLATFDFIKGRYPGVYIFMHSCGSIYPIIGDLIDVGLDILNPVQTTAANMEPERLKSEFGKDLTFWGGGADTQGALPFGTPDDVRRDVSEKIRTLAPGGGFVFTQSHNIAPEVPPENILAMFETVRELGKYPIT